MARYLKNNPYIKFSQALDQAIAAGEKFFLYRSIEGKVTEIEIAFCHFNTTTAMLELTYIDEQKDDFITSDATDLDLKLISQQAAAKKAAQAK